jgi:dinuclear metal center YbgI/SA1388 family protein
MSTRLNVVVRLLNKELEIKNIKDRSKNGLQVRASDKINKVGLATDACLDVFKKAKSLKCDLVIVHHGLFWKGQKDTANIIKNRVSFLKKNHISLYAAHLPLDKSKKYGHNMHIFELLNGTPKGTFGSVGYLGNFKTSKSIYKIKKEVEVKLNTKCKLWKFGKTNIRKIAVVSGAGTSTIQEAIKKKVDLFITGELSSWNYYTAKEAKLNVLLAGHYKTETSGVKAVGQLLKRKLKLNSIFIDLPTGL